MKLYEFSNRLKSSNGTITRNGETLPIVVFKSLVLKNRFQKTDREEFTELSERDYARMANMPIYLMLPHYHIPPTFNPGEILPAPGSDTICFVPDLRKGFVRITKKRVLIHLYFYEK